MRAGERGAFNGHAGFMPVSLWTGAHVAVFMPLLLASNRVCVPLLSDLRTQKQRTIHNRPLGEVP